MKDKSELLWGMYQEHCVQGRHHEDQRANSTNILVAVAGGVLAFIANDGVKKDEWPLAAFLIAIGVFGALFSAKQYEKSRFHMTAAGKYRWELENEAKVDLSSIRQSAGIEHKKQFPRLVPIRLFYFWIALHLVIAGLGLFLLIHALSKAS
jgi:hypothetical protein